MSFLKNNFVISCQLFISEEEEVDKMMEQKLKEEEERKRKKEMEERMSLEETKEQVSLFDCQILKLGLFTKRCRCYCTGLLLTNIFTPSLWLQIMKMGVKLQGLQEEKHQLFLQLKKVLHEEEKRRRKEQRYGKE